MWSLFSKEIRQFFSGAAAYLVLALFYTANALMLFVLPVPFNIFNGGYASLDGFFSWAPWMFLFLVPAICMRSFSEEKKTGTIEMLLTKPLSAMHVVWAKYAGCFLIFVLALLPTFVYLYTVSTLALPAGNVDTGAFWGAFCGLLLLGAVFTAVCIFTSTLTDNQVVSFVLGAACCAVLYAGFGLFAGLDLKGGAALALSKLGIQYHYSSLSRGVIDLRDAGYYLAVTALFGWAAVCRISGIKSRESGVALIPLSAAVLMLAAASLWPLRLDLTADKRYTLLPVTKQILKQNRQPVLVNVYLTGDMPAGFKRLEKSVRQTLDEFRIHHPSLRYRFIDLYKMDNPDMQQQQMQMLAEMGIQPTQLEVKTKAGTTRRLVWPAAEVRTGGNAVAVNLLGAQLGRGAEETLNNSIENIEIQLINAIRSLLQPCTESVVFLEGNGEEGYMKTVSFGSALGTYYKATRTALTESPGCLLVRDSAGNWQPKYTAAVLVRPVQRFTEAQKFVLDQYVMYGGKVLWLLDAGNGSLDSLRGETLFNAMPYDLNLEDMFFRYGFRLRPEMLLDKNAAPVPVVTGYMGQQPLIEFIPNYYCPVIDVPGTGAVKLQVAGGLDTIENSVTKKVLLSTSNYSYRIRLPHAMSADLMRNDIDLERFHESSQMAGLELSGVFPSAFPLVKPALKDADGFVARKESMPGKMVVIADGDIACNEWLAQTRQPLPVGMDRYTLQMYANGDFLMETVHNLCGHTEFAQLKPRTVSMRLLDKASLTLHRKRYTVECFVIPLGLLALFGAAFVTWRKRKYASAA